MKVHARFHVADELRRAGIETADAEARWILEASERGVAPVDELVARRSAGEPLQYVTGLAGFRRLELEVGPGVFIPRPETEVVAGAAIERVCKDGVAIDLCTGSGAIAFSLADERPDVEVWATEHSVDALSWAVKNRERLDLPVQLLEGDLFKPLPLLMSGRVDLVVANPPYVAFEELAALPLEVVGYEPSLALFAPRAGLAVIESIAGQARHWLRPGGWLVLEIGASQGPSVDTLLRGSGYEEVEIGEDLTGRDRVAIGRRSR